MLDGTIFSTSSSRGSSKSSTLRFSDSVTCDQMLGGRLGHRRARTDLPCLPCSFALQPCLAWPSCCTWTLHLNVALACCTCMLHLHVALAFMCVVASKGNSKRKQRQKQTNTNNNKGNSKQTQAKTKSKASKHKQAQRQKQANTSKHEGKNTRT